MKCMQQYCYLMYTQFHFKNKSNICHIFWLLAAFSPMLAEAVATVKNKTHTLHVEAAQPSGGPLFDILCQRQRRHGPLKRTRTSHDVLHFILFIISRILTKKGRYYFRLHKYESPMHICHSRRQASAQTLLNTIEHSKFHKLHIGNCFIGL